MAREPHDVPGDDRHRPVVMVGAGIAGLSAARDLVAAGREVVLVEATDRVGGKLRAGEVAGITVDVGAEAMINRRPEAVGLTTELGLPITHPAGATSRIWTRGALRPLPRTLMGAPLDLDQLADSGILDVDGVARARREPDLVALDLPEDADLSVGDLVDARYGAEVTDRLVEPLLGGVYAGRARAISVRAAMPQLLMLARRGSIAAQAGATAPATAATPVFAGIAGGIWQLPDALRRELMASGRCEIRTGVTVTAVRRTAAGFALVLTPAGTPSHRGEEVLAGQVVLAVPAGAASRLLGDVAPDAAAELAAIDYASTALVTFAFRSADAGAALDVGASGFLVPPVDGRRIKAATFSFAKWDWVREAGAAGDAGEHLLVLRTSLGRVGEEQTLQVSDDELIAASRSDLQAATGLSAAPVDAVVQRWGGGLPQYAVGHLDRVDRIRSAAAHVPGIALCGAAYDGVGIPATIASAHRAVADLRSCCSE